MSTLSRRHFLISGGALLGACFLPASLFRRANDHLLATNKVLIEPPERARRTLYATAQDGANVWQLALGRPTTELPSAPTWRKWLSDHEDVDPADPGALAKWVGERWEEEDAPSGNWLDSEVSDGLWDNYLEGGFAISNSSEARALHYLLGLKLDNGPLTDGSGRDLGTVDFYRGTMPGADWHFVNVEGEMILPALQGSLLELGENTGIEIAS